MTDDVPPRFDTIAFTLSGEEAIHDNTVRVTVFVVAMLPTNDADHEQLTGRVKAALAKLIPDAAWQFSNITRAAATAGYEQVSVTATSRVASTENFNLAKRAQDASEQGLTLGTPRVEYAPPRSLYNQAQQALHIALLKTADDHARAYAAATGRAWRIGSVELADPGAQRISAASNNLNAFRSSTYEAVGFDDDEMPSSHKLTAVATVELRAPFPEGNA